ncbi:MAG: hypothetical protein IKU70_01680 [Clostridia bacterium]|nr:hypothetical protein [Clostridia bacterium]
MSNALIGAPWLRAMARVFDNAGAELYIVGGAVRNPLMGLPLSDIDVCGPARPEDVCAFCEGTEIRAHLRAAHFGTVELHITDENGKHQMAEYTTWREDSYRCGHRPDSVKFTNDIRVDSLRRDFSVNALYRRVRPDHLEDVIDPTGGLEHLKQGVLHTVTHDPDHVLGDDGLRILRAARFQAELDLLPTPELMESLARNARLLADIACERLRDELQKVLMADLRYPTLKRRFPATFSGLSTIQQIGAWTYLFGDIAYDEEAAAALRSFAVPSLPARMALLMRRADPIKVVESMQRMRFSAKETEQAKTYVTALQNMGAPLFELVKPGIDALETALRIFRALGDESGVQAAQTVLKKLEGKPLSLKELAVSGNDLKPLFAARNRPMREMGRVLDQLWQAVIEEDYPNEREALLGHPILKS